MLEVYLNLIKFAPNVYGIQDASFHYFGKETTELTLTEMLVLSYIIPRPIFFHEALLEQAQQLKQNLYHHIHFYSTTLYYRKMIDKNSLRNIDYVIKFTATYHDLILRKIDEIILHCPATK